MTAVRAAGYTSSLTRGECKGLLKRSCLSQIWINTSFVFQNSVAAHFSVRIVKPFLLEHTQL